MMTGLPSRNPRATLAQLCVWLAMRADGLECSIALRANVFPQL
jgi:hypothetical protein